VLLIVGTIRLPAERWPEALPAMEAMILASRAEAGCIDYVYAADLLDPGLVHVKERWADRPSLDAHFRSAHIAAWRAAWPKLGIGDRNLQLFEVGDPEVI